MATQMIKAKDKYAQMYDFVCVFQHDKDVFTVEEKSTVYNSLKEAVSSLPDKTIYALIRPGHPLYVSQQGKVGVMNVIKLSDTSYVLYNLEGKQAGTYTSLDGIRAAVDNGQVIRIFDSQDEYDQYYENEWTKDLAIQIKMAGKS